MVLSDNETKARFSAKTDFITRKQKPSLVLVLLSFVVILFLCIAVIVTTVDKRPLIFLLFFVLATFGSYVIILLQRSRDIVLATEFQNALFASALDYNRTFCLIIKNDGNIVYMDRSFQKIFPAFMKESHLTLTTFIEHGKIESSEASRILGAVERGTSNQSVCTAYGSDGRVHKLVISVEPIPRPAGFVMLHSREYVEKRKDNIGAPPSDSVEQTLLSRSSLTLFSNLLNQMHTGFYVIDTAGNIIFANSTLEKWLAYDEREIATGTFSLRDIIQHDDSGNHAMSPNDFDGEAMLRKNPGGLMRVNINQKLIHSDDRKVMGCLAIVTPFAEADSTAKKKLW